MDKNDEEMWHYNSKIEMQVLQICFMFVKISSVDRYLCFVQIKISALHTNTEHCYKLVRNLIWNKALSAPQNFPFSFFNNSNLPQKYI